MLTRPRNGVRNGPRNRDLYRPLNRLQKEVEIESFLRAKCDHRRDEIDPALGGEKKGGVISKEGLKHGSPRGGGYIYIYIYIYGHRSYPPAIL